MTKAICRIKAFNWGLAYGFRGLVHDHHGEKHGSKQTGMSLEQKLRAYISSSR